MNKLKKINDIVTDLQYLSKVVEDQDVLLRKLLIGKVVVINRGSNHQANNLRRVKVRVIAMEGWDITGELLQDDPQDKVGWKNIGDVGNWSVSSIIDIEN